MSSIATTSAPDLQNYFNGAWQRSAATEFVDVANPATAEILGRTRLSTASDVDAVVKAAADAFPAWRRVPAGERVQYLFKLKNLLEEHIDEISRLITLEHGQTLGAETVDV